MWVTEEQKYLRKSLRTKDFDTALIRAEDKYLQTYSDITTGRKIFGMSLGQLVSEFIDWRAEDVDAGNITHQMRPFDMGCHSDSGYSHQQRNLYSQMIYGSSFEAPFPVGSADGTGWRDASTGGGRATLDTTAPFNGQSSQKLSGSGAAVANRGLGNEGLVFAAGYFARCDDFLELRMWKRQRWQ